MPMAFQLLLVISGVESPTQATEDSFYGKKENTAMNRIIKTNAPSCVFSTKLVFVYNVPLGCNFLFPGQRLSPAHCFAR